MNSRTLMSLAMLLFSTPILAEPATSTGGVSTALSDVYGGLNGSEIRISGAIGTIFGDTVYFADQTGRYKVLLDAGRKFRKDLEGCELQMFETLASPCQFTGMAEISIELDDDNLGDGLDISFIIYEVEEFMKQAQ